MKNVRLEGDTLFYDCDGANCETPGVPHTISIKALMATLEASYREFVFHHDPRAEGLDVALQLMFQTFYPNDASHQAPLGPTAPWHVELLRLIEHLDSMQDDPPELSDDERAAPKKTYVN